MLLCTVSSSINLCSWSLCCIECKLGYYWTQKFLTSCTGKFCAAFELEHFTPSGMKKYVLLESPLPFSEWHLVLNIKLCWNWSQPSFKVVSLRICYKFALLVSAFYSYHKIMLKLDLALFQSSFTSPLLQVCFATGEWSRHFISTVLLWRKYY